MFTTLTRTLCQLLLIGCRFSKSPSLPGSRVSLNGLLCRGLLTGQIKSRPTLKVISGTGINISKMMRVYLSTSFKKYRLIIHTDAPDYLERRFSTHKLEIVETLTIIADRNVVPVGHRHCLGRRASS